MREYQCSCEGGGRGGEGRGEAVGRGRREGKRGKGGEGRGRRVDVTMYIQESLELKHCSQNCRNLGHQYSKGTNIRT